MLYIFMNYLTRFIGLVFDGISRLVKFFKLQAARLVVILLRSISGLYKNMQTLWPKLKVWIGSVKKIAVVIPLALLISISQNLSSRSELEFSFSGAAGGPVTEEGALYYQYRHEGLILNRSKEKNTITNIGLVVWANERQEEVLRDGYGPSWMTEEKSGESIKLPLVIEGREAVHIAIYNKFLVEGSEDEKLLKKVKHVGPREAGLTIPAYTYELTFSDVNGNEFDQRGRLINRDLIDMNWTLDSYCGELHYKLGLCESQKIKIQIVRIVFKIKTFFHWFGMENIGDLIYQIFAGFEKNP